jgi:uncharacterized protein
MARVYEPTPDALNRLPATTPVDASERLHALDIVRGFALFGMILVHFHQKMRLPASGIEDLIGWGVWLFVEQKAWGTFAFLFGVGFAILLRRLEARGASVVPIYLRRLAMLAVFGIVAQVAFGFTILFEYAFWGVALLVMRRWSTRALLITTALVACARPVAGEIRALHAWWTSAAPVVPPIAAFAQAVETASAQGSYAALVSARWSLFLASYSRWWTYVPDSNLALFTLGLLAVRHRILDEPRRHVRLIRWWMIAGAASWASSWVLLARVPELPIPGTAWPLQSGMGLVQDQWLCFTYVGALVLLLEFRPQWKQRLAIVGLAGRMALTNYMLQIIVLDVLASGYGLHLKLRPYVYVVDAVLLFASEALISRAWLARYRFGPLEWVWRTATYLQPQRMRVRATALAVSSSESR